VDSIELAASNVDVTRFGSSGGYENGIVATTQFFPADVFTDLYACAESRPLCLHLSDSTIDVVFFHFEVGNAIAKQTANSVVALKYRNGVARSG
jgi:hypothetical protein